jgi:hypothetical protein
MYSERPITVEVAMRTGLPAADMTRVGNTLLEMGMAPIKLAPAREGDAVRLLVPTADFQELVMLLEAAGRFDLTIEDASPGHPEILVDALHVPA